MILCRKQRLNNCPYLNKLQCLFNQFNSILFFPIPFSPFLALSVSVPSVCCSVLVGVFIALSQAPKCQMCCCCCFGCPNWSDWPTLKTGRGILLICLPRLVSSVLSPFCSLFVFILPWQSEDRRHCWREETKRSGDQEIGRPRDRETDRETGGSWKIHWAFCCRCLVVVAAARTGLSLNL